MEQRELVVVDTRCGHARIIAPSGRAPPRGHECSQPCRRHLDELVVARRITDIEPRQHRVVQMVDEGDRGPAPDRHVAEQRADELVRDADDPVSEPCRVVGEPGFVSGVHPEQAEAIGIVAGHDEQRPHDEVAVGRSLIPGEELVSQADHDPLEHGSVQVLLRPEVPVDDQPRDAGGVGDVLHRGAVEAGVRERPRPLLGGSTPGARRGSAASAENRRRISGASVAVCIRVSIQLGAVRRKGAA